MELSANTSKNIEVQKFLEEIMTVDDKKITILEELRKIVFAHFKETNERIMYGGIMFSNERDKDWGWDLPLQGSYFI